MKICFSGTSGIGHRHIENVLALRPDAQLFAIRDGESETTRKFDMTVVANTEAALSYDLDAAVVALPPSLHAAAAKSYLDAGVPLYLEKPVAMRVDEIHDTALAAERAGLVTMVGCHLRMTPGFAKLKGLISEGAIGPVHTAHLSVGQWLPDWRPGRDYRDTYSAQRKLGGGVLLDLVHELDMARNLFGEFSELTARSGNTGLLEIDTEDHADILLQRDDMTVNVHLDYLDKSSHRNGRIIGENGTLIYDVIQKTMARYDIQKRNWVDLYETGDFDSATALKNSMAQFLSCVEQGQPTDQPLMEGVRSLELSERARRAAGLMS